MCKGYTDSAKPKLKMQLIPLTRGKVSVVDEDDYERLSQFRWSCHQGYAAGWVNGKVQLLHRYILGVCDDPVLVDHINGDGLDNRKENLRICTKQQNCMNRKLNENNTSGYKGVSRHEKLWAASIRKDGVRVYLGRYATKEEAALAYNRAAIENFGEFARLNIIDIKNV